MYRGKYQDIKGRRFGRLVALRSAGKAECFAERWTCLCDCGRTVEVFKNHLLSGHTRSCGCMRSDFAKGLNGKKHGSTTSLGFQERKGTAGKVHP